MTNREYNSLLQALFRKHMLPQLRDRDMSELGLRLEEELDRLSGLARHFNHFAYGPSVIIEDERPPEVDLTDAMRLMDECGLLAALDEVPSLVFSNLRRSAVPDEDLIYLAQAGVPDPEAELTITIAFAHTLRKQPGDVDAAIGTAQVSVSAAVRRLRREASASAPSKPRRKLFNGIGKILSGSVAGVGNVLLDTGTVLAPNPALAYGAIASGAVAVGAICQGIGDLRGE